jgi:hypothetical protein
MSAIGPGQADDVLYALEGGRWLPRANSDYYLRMIVEKCKATACDESDRWVNRPGRIVLPDREFPARPRLRGLAALASGLCLGHGRRRLPVWT